MGNITATNKIAILTKREYKKITSLINVLERLGYKVMTNGEYENIQEELQEVKKLNIEEEKMQGEIQDLIKRIDNIANEQKKTEENRKKSNPTISDYIAEVRAIK